jgi:hypothetical protein
MASPAAVAGPCFFVCGGGGGRAKNRCAIFLSQANRRAFAPVGAKALAGSLLRSSKPLLGPRPCRPRIRFPTAKRQRTMKTAPLAFASGAVFIVWWWRRRLPNILLQPAWMLTFGGGWMHSYPKSYPLMSWVAKILDVVSVLQDIGFEPSDGVAWSLVLLKRECPAPTSRRFTLRSCSKNFSRKQHGSGY